MRVVILGAGFGGLEIATLLSDEFGTAADVVLIDKGEGFIFGFSKLDVMFGRASTSQARRIPYADLVKPGVRFVNATVLSVDRSTNGSSPTARPSRLTSSSSLSGPISTLLPRPVW